jgi:hypothetical protein
MKTTITFLQTIICCMILMVIFSESLVAQVSPYSLSPQWRFGVQSGLNFPSGSYPTSGAPVSTPAASNSGTAFVEGSTSVCDTVGVVAIYTNTMFVYNKTNASVRNLTNVGGDNKCGGSAIAGGVAIPDPASPGDTYYLFVANDISGGACQFMGINYYKFRKDGAGNAQYLSGPTNLIGNVPDECLASSTDGKGTYWLFSHSKSTNDFYRWRVDASGVTALANTAIGNASGGNSSSLKFSPCQDKVAWYGGGQLAVYNFNRATGAIGALIRSWVDVNFKYGLEFSPDGNILYVAGQGSTVQYYNITTGAAVATLAGAGAPSSWSMQLGPDGKIYTSGPQSSTTVGVINDPNNPTTTTYGSYALANSTYRGLINLSWLTPDQAKINAVITGCHVDFSYIFKNYFKSNIPIQAGTESWDFGDGSPLGSGAAPSHNYPSGTNSYNVTLTFNDGSLCNHPWSATLTVNTSCVVAPVTLTSFTGIKGEEGTTLLWSTASEINNDYFEIQRSDDGIHFYTVGKVKGNNSPSYYSFEDTKSNNVVYYRLVQHDIDGKTTNSNVVTINSEYASPVISPNPFSHNFTVSFAANENAEVKVIDMLGRIIEKRTVGNNSHSIVLGEELNRGSYIICVSTETENYYYKIIKE